MNELLSLYGRLTSQLDAFKSPNVWSAAINLRLERISHLLDLLGNPQAAYPIIHVGGTSGKGSTATMIASILTAAGYQTGLHVSPPLQVVNEQVQIDGSLAPTTLLLALLEQMDAAIAGVAASNPFGSPSYFEVVVALSLLTFQRRGVDVAVVEVGLGGTLDATNVVPARVAVLTSVGLDHTAILGETVEEITADKAGIIKPGQVVISGVQQTSAQAIIATRCQTRNAQLLQLGADFDFHRQLAGLQVRTPLGTLSGLAVRLAGGFQDHNGTLAVMAAQKYGQLMGSPLDDSAIRAGLATAQIPGRMELVQRTPTVILDGAHNPDKMAAAAKALASLAPETAGSRCIGVVALKSGKSVAEVLSLVSSVCDEIIVTEFHHTGLWESVPAAQLAAHLRSEDAHIPIHVEANPAAAVQLALDTAGAHDRVWVTGSLYLVGDVRGRWVPQINLLEQAERDAL